MILHRISQNVQTYYIGSLQIFQICPFAYLFLISYYLISTCTDSTLSSLSYLTASLTPLPKSQEDDGLRKRKVTSLGASHSSTMATSAMRDEGLSTRIVALCVLFFVIGVIIGKLVL